MDILVKEIDGKDTIWYSSKYVESQIEQAYQVGLFKGIKVEFHAVSPFNDDMVDDLISEFKKRVQSEYELLISKLHGSKKIGY